MLWKVNSEEPLYRDEWLDIRLADVELPDGRHLSHRLIRTPPGAGAVVVDDHQRVLLLWRHRFITDTWNYEIPIGKIDPGEAPMDAAAREVEEETGWRPGPLRPLLYCQPTNGLSDSEHHIFRADSANISAYPRKRGNPSGSSGCRWRTSESSSTSGTSSVAPPLRPSCTSWPSSNTRESRTSGRFQLCVAIRRRCVVPARARFTPPHDTRKRTRPGRIAERRASSPPNRPAGLLHISEEPGRRLDDRFQGVGR
jgi:8-oxo-dGTP pyrophosphatase MutT (NUDIX family)